MIDNYFVVIRACRKGDYSDSLSRFYFFDGRDPQSVEQALKMAQADANRGGRSQDGYRRNPIASYRPVFTMQGEEVLRVGESRGSVI